jgi:hypothetical protein
VPPKLDATHKAFLARIVEEGPIPAIDGVALAGVLLDHLVGEREHRRRHGQAECHRGREIDS